MTENFLNYMRWSGVEKKQRRSTAVTTGGAAAQGGQLVGTLSTGFIDNSFIQARPTPSISRSFTAGAALSGIMGVYLVQNTAADAIVVMPAQANASGTLADGISIGTVAEGASVTVQLLRPVIDISAVTSTHGFNAGDAVYLSQTAAGTLVTSSNVSATEDSYLQFIGTYLGQDLLILGDPPADLFDNQ